MYIYNVQSSITEYGVLVLHSITDINIDVPYCWRYAQNKSYCFSTRCDVMACGDRRFFRQRYMGFQCNYHGPLCKFCICVIPVHHHVIFVPAIPKEGRPARPAVMALLLLFYFSFFLPLDLTSPHLTSSSSSFFSVLPHLSFIVQRGLTALFRF